MRVNKLFILVGESGCRKSTLEREIADRLCNEAMDEIE